MRILVKAVAGSHLFGTNTISSDKDFKGIYLPTADEILLNKFDKTKHIKTNNTNTKNTSEDVDIEFYSLDKFLLMLYQGQTVAWELLFTPDDKILEADPLWYEIRAAAPTFLNKNVDAFLGYCKQQANKYGIRGSRMNTVERVLSILKNYPKQQLLKGIDEWDQEKINNCEHVEMIKDKNGKDLLVICGKKFGLDTSLQYVVAPLQLYYETYGERSKLAKENEGVDFKALSHAVRVCMQASSLLTKGKIDLPMTEVNVTLLKKIKAGELPFLEVSQIIEDSLDLVLVDKAMSTLPDKSNLEAFEYWQKKIYGQIVNEHFVEVTWKEILENFDEKIK